MGVKPPRANSRRYTRSPVTITLRRLLFTGKYPPALDAKRRSPTKIGSGDQAAARFEKVFAQAYEVKHRCRCWAWLILGEGGCIVP